MKQQVISLQRVTTLKQKKLLEINSIYGHLKVQAIGHFSLVAAIIPKPLQDAGISKTINDGILGRRLMI
ncbi:MAG: hypothetical protein ACJAT7_001740 [Psychromonas sp.]